MILPNGVSVENFKKAVKKFKEIVGEDNVIDNQKDIYLYRDAYSPEWDEETEPIPSLAMVKTLYSILHRSLDLTEFMEEVLIDDNMVFDIDNLKGFLNDTSSFGFIAKENNKIIGFAYCYTLLRPDGKTMFYLHSIGMLPNYQDKGYGSKLLSFIKEYSKEIGCSEMFLITDKGNPRACHVYEKLGGKNDYKDEIVYVYDYEKGDK